MSCQKWMVEDGYVDGHRWFSLLHFLLGGEKNTTKMIFSQEVYIYKELYKEMTQQ